MLRQLPFAVPSTTRAIKAIVGSSRSVRAMRTLPFAVRARTHSIVRPTASRHLPSAASSRSLCSAHDADAAAARAFIEARGFEPAVARAVVQNLLGPDWDTPKGGVMRMVERLAGRWEVGEDAGLVALAKAVEREMAETTGKALVSILVHPPRGEAPFVCEGHEGATLRDVREHGTGAGSKLLAEYLECACSGVAACSTCHVYVAPEWWEAVGAPSEDEEDMLYAY